MAIPDINSLYPSSGARWKEYIIISLLGAIPLSLGSRLRRIFYRSLFGRMGRSVNIQPGVDLVGTPYIELGYNVNLFRHVRLNGLGQNSKIHLGDNVCLDHGVHICVVTQHGNCHIEIDDETYIGPYVCITGPGHIKIGKNCLIASHTGIYANNHNFADPTRKIAHQGVTSKGIEIGDDCWIGNGVTVIDGVTIGEGSVIGAGAVVTKDIPPYSVAVGVPAKVISRRDGKPMPEKVLNP